MPTLPLFSILLIILLLARGGELSALYLFFLASPLGFQGHCLRLIRDGAEDVSIILLEFLWKPHLKTICREAQWKAALAFSEQILH